MANVGRTSQAQGRRGKQGGRSTDPAKLLKQDHRTVKALFRKLVRASAPRERQKLGQEIIKELSVHAAIEEQIVYPALRSSGKARLEELTLNALEEHHAVKLVLHELEEMPVDHERYAAKMHQVQEAVEMHIEEEEAELLPRLERLLAPEERRAMAAAIITMKPRAPTRPDPYASDTPSATSKRDVQDSQ